MKKDLKRKLKNFSKKVGLISVAILWCLAERGGAVLGEMVGVNKGKRSYSEYDLKTVDDCYEILKNLNKNSAKTILWRLEKKGLIKKDKDGPKLTMMGRSFYETIKKTESTLLKMDHL